MKDLFEGVYLKHQKNGESICFIAGRAGETRFVQVITNGTVRQYDGAQGFCFGEEGVAAELPGVQRDQMNVDVENGVLTISAEWKQEHESNDGYVMNERRYGKMQRSFNIDGVDENAITAAYTDGILKLTLPKKAEVSNTRKINIQ